MTRVYSDDRSGLSSLRADGLCLGCFNFIRPGIAIDGGDDGCNGYNGTMSKFQIALLKRKGRVAALEEEIEGQSGNKCIEISKLFNLPTSVNIVSLIKDINRIQTLDVCRATPRKTANIWTFFLLSLFYLSKYQKIILISVCRIYWELKNFIFQIWTYLQQWHLLFSLGWMSVVRSREQMCESIVILLCSGTSETRLRSQVHYTCRHCPHTLGHTWRAKLGQHASP